jgi:hypothetical protein
VSDRRLTNRLSNGTAEMALTNDWSLAMWLVVEPRVGQLDYIFMFAATSIFGPTRLLSIACLRFSSDEVTEVSS